MTWKYWDYLVNPWTRNGQLSANVVRVAPRVSGPIVELPIVDNQRIEQGDLLFRIDQRTYRAAFEQATAELDATRDQLANLAEQVNAAEAALKQDSPEPKPQPKADAAAAADTPKDSA